MKKLFNIPTNQQLFDISNSINEYLNDIRKENIHVVFELNKDLLRQVDEDYFFKNNKDAKMSDFVESDEVEVIVNDIKFKFVEKKDDENS